MGSARRWSWTVPLTGLLLVCAVAGDAAAGWGDENWGEMIWGGGPSPVPVVGPWGLVFLAGLLVGMGAVAGTRGPRTAPLLIALAALPLVAQAVTLPHTFSNGTVADADEVNANFDALATAVEHRTIARSTGLGPDDDSDSGPIATRVLSVTKARSDTALRISYTDNRRVFGSSYALCRWEVRVDGVSCPSGPLVYDYLMGDSQDNDHRSETVVGYCTGLAAGSHTLQVHVGAVPPFAAGDCYTGFSTSTWVLESEEVF